MSHVVINQVENVLKPEPIHFQLCGEKNVVELIGFLCLFELILKVAKLFCLSSGTTGKNGPQLLSFLPNQVCLVLFQSCSLAPQPAVLTVLRRRPLTDCELN